jgi:FkbM family methyltransferase
MTLALGTRNKKDNKTMLNTAKFGMALAIGIALATQSACDKGQSAPVPSAAATESPAAPPPPQPPAPPPSFVSASALTARLLRDEDTLKKYLEAFPKADYEVRTWQGVGSFYIDSVDDAIKKHLHSGAGWEAHIKALIQQHAKPATAVLDVGAHIGTHTLSMAKAVGDQGKVFAFEPQKKIYRELVKNLELNGVKNVAALRYALGEGEPSIVEMGVAAKGNEGGTGVGSGGDKVELRTIDSFGFHHVSLMKIDVEGFENHVLRGSKETIARERPILIVEILGGVDYGTATPEQKQRIDETKALIAGMGYRVERVGPHDYMGTPST